MPPCLYNAHKQKVKFTLFFKTPLTKASALCLIMLIELVHGSGLYSFPAYLNSDSPYALVGLPTTFLPSNTLSTGRSHEEISGEYFVKAPLINFFIKGYPQMGVGHGIRPVP